MNRSTPRSHPRARGLTVALAVAMLSASCSSGPSEPETRERALGSGEFVLEDPRIDESSGLAPSRSHPGVFYTHNDMGSEPQVFAVDSETGATEAVLDIGSVNVDWEDIAVTGSGVWIGDIGGNDPARTTVSVVTFPEPITMEDGTPRSTEYELTYEDGAHNAEALLVDPSTDQLYVVTKDRNGGGIYSAPDQLGPGENILTRVADAPPNVTGGSWAPEGSGFALRNYARAYVYDELGERPRTVVELPESPQGESLVLLEDGDLLVGSEGSGSEVVRVAVPNPPG